MHARRHARERIAAHASRNAASVRLERHGPGGPAGLQNSCGRVTHGSVSSTPAPLRHPLTHTVWPRSPSENVLPPVDRLLPRQASLVLCSPGHDQDAEEARSQWRGSSSPWLHCNARGRTLPVQDSGSDCDHSIAITRRSTARGRRAPRAGAGAGLRESCSSTRTTSCTTPASRSSRPSGRSRSSSARTGPGRSSSLVSSWSTRRRARQSTAWSTISSTRATRVPSSSSRRRSRTCVSRGRSARIRTATRGSSDTEGLRSRSSRVRRRPHRRSDRRSWRSSRRRRSRSSAGVRWETSRIGSSSATPGRSTGTEVSQRASDEATFACSTHREIYSAQAGLERRAATIAGRSAATPQFPMRLRQTSCSSEATFSSRARAPVWGYLSESALMFVGEPADQEACSRTWSRSRTSPSGNSTGRDVLGGRRRGARVLRAARSAVVLEHRRHAIGLRYHEGRSSTPATTPRSARA